LERSWVFADKADARRLAPRTLGPMSDALESSSRECFDFPISLV
jgi:hypothetical protein